MSKIERIVNQDFSPTVSLKARGLLSAGKDETPALCDVNILASYKMGSFAIVVPETGMMISIRLDEAIELMAAAARLGMEGRKE